MFSVRLGALFLLLFLGGLAPDLAAQASAPPPGWRVGSSALPDSHTLLFNSRISGRTYQVSVALPFEYARTERQYPVLVALDANAQFGTVVEAARYLAATDQIPDLIVVGIGYPGERMWNQTFPRLVDLAPWPDTSFLTAASRQYAPRFGQPEGTGGGPLFLRALVEEILPAVEGTYRVDEADRGLYGHSLAGLFTVYALFEAQGIFERFIAGSPELPWSALRIFEFEREHRSDGGELRGRVFLSAGAAERPALLSSVQEFVAVLRDRQHRGLMVASHLFADENHVSVIPATISRGLRAVYSK